MLCQKGPDLSDVGSANLQDRAVFAMCFEGQLAIEDYTKISDMKANVGVIV